MFYYEYLEPKETIINPQIMEDSKPTPKRKYNLVIKRIPQTHLKIKQFGITNTPEFLPTIIDLRPKLPPCYDQGELGTSTANALCAALQYEEPTFFGSRLFIYYNERSSMKHINDEDDSYSLSNSIATLEKFGVCEEHIWPYDVSKYLQPPSVDCYLQADKHHVIQATNILNNEMAMKQSLAEGSPFVVGIQIFEAFESPEVAQTGIVPMPNLFTDECLGGHAVFVCGYDDTKQHWIVRNSWGTQWGDNGYFYLPYHYLLYPTLCSELWSISRVQKPSSTLVKPSPITPLPESLPSSSQTEDPLKSTATSQDASFCSISISTTTTVGTNTDILEIPSIPPSNVDDDKLQPRMCSCCCF
jgi:hypothetical protein